MPPDALQSVPPFALRLISRPVFGGLCAAGRSAYFWKIEKTHGESDRRHVFNAMVVYELPFGTGRAMNPANVVARGLVSGWRLSSITRLRSGLPYGIIGASCNLPSAGGCRASYDPNFTGSVRINGE
jgi:hypothetical protein